MSAGRERRRASVETIPAPGRRGALVGLLGVLLVAYLAFAAAAAQPSPAGLAAAAAAVLVAELLLDRWAPFGSWALDRAGLGVAGRALLRGVLLVLFADRAGPDGPAAATALAVLVLAGAHALRSAAAQAVVFLRAPAALSRGLALRVPGVPAAPPRALLAPAGWAALVELPAAVGLAAAHGRMPGPAVVGLLVSVLLGLGASGLLGVNALMLHRRKVRPRVTAAVREQLLELAPEVILYFGGGPTWTYQVEGWLEPVERLGRPAVVLVRDREALAALAPTTLPVVCVPNGSALTALELPRARVSLFVANTGDSMHLLRRRETRSAFIGHGDSDKAASTNPFSRVYDEIWVAGPAGRERYLEAALGVGPDRIIEVGRPQLASRPGSRPPVDGSRLTVLYAPTWEGWGDDPFHTSVSTLGVRLVRALLSRSRVRVLYRPHPLAGSRDAAVGRADAEIEQLLRDAGAIGPEQVPPPPALEPGRARRGDLLDLALASSSPAWSRQDHLARTEAWTRQYWEAAPRQHRILRPPAPDLAASFAVADALVADVSSVATEFLATGRPYAIVNASARTDRDFRAAYPSAAGGYLLDPDLTELGVLLVAAAGGVDPLGRARRAARDHLLGPPMDDPDAAFRAAVDRLCGAERGAPRTSAAPSARVGGVA